VAADAALQRRALASLALVACVLPLCTDSLSPVLPRIATDLEVAPAAVKLLISAFTLGFGLAHLFVGSLLDRFGRRPVLVAAMLLVAITASTGATAQDLPTIVGARFLQGLAAAAAPIAMRAIVRDLFPPEQAIGALTRLGLGIAATAMGAPFLGIAIGTRWGWPANFWLLAALAAIIAAFVAARLPETLARPDPLALSPAATLAAVRRALAEPRFRGNALAAACGYGGILTVLTSSAFMAPRLLPGVSTAAAWLVSCGGFGYLLGTLAGLLLRARGVAANTATLGAALASLAAALAAAGHGLLGLPAGPLYLGALVAFGAGWGLIQPWAQTHALAGNERDAGRVSALYGATQIALASLAVMLLGPWLREPLDLFVAWSASAAAAGLAAHRAHSTPPSGTT
jgi:DHA1 family bicyclomycin/chloramphenicol resistance-like MFS transporter